ncbi:isochorismate synthase [Actinoalloteichus spitiensis]|uniref:isochorismate synthase n=1 Tax=Actinoalloteichus spitiensis TaxID=252394 RepID=UPI00036650D3
MVMADHVTTDQGSELDLLGEYRAGSSFFLTAPRHSLLASRAGEVLPVEGTAATPAVLAEEVADSLGRWGGSQRVTGGGPAVVVGAVPFSPTSPPHLVLPTEARWSGPARPGWRPVPPVSSYGWSVRPEPPADRYLAGVSKALEAFDAGELEKVVLARTLRLTAGEPVAVARLLAHLAHRDPTGYTFAVDLPPELERPRTLLGTSPELLVRRSGTRVLSNPLAGSAARSPDPAEDRSRAAALLASEKDRHEHALVVEAVAERLRPYCRELEVPSEPSLVTTATMWHLSTRVAGVLDDPAPSALELASALHPTPAVCGTPTETARKAIEDIEPFDRGFYTGTLGWCDANGDGEWVVAIRCAEVAGESIRLFAGGGIVPGSDPHGELAESSAKFRTLLLAMGLDQEL